MQRWSDSGGSVGRCPGSVSRKDVKMQKRLVRKTANGRRPTPIGRYAADRLNEKVVPRLIWLVTDKVLSWA